MGTEEDMMEVDPPAAAPSSSTGVDESKATNGESDTVYAPNFDLEQYAARYTGYTKIVRLLFIAGRSKHLELDAYRLAIDALKKGIDTDTYKKVMSRVGGRLGDAYAYDASWVEATDKRAAQIRERLESDLNGSKTNMIKESIRMGYTDLGDFCHQRGDLENALKNYVRTRDYCHVTRHNIDMCLNVIKVSVDMRSFAHVSNYVSKAEHTPDLQDPLALSKLRAAAGLAQLSQSNYVGAARKFLECSSADHFGTSSSSAAASGDQAPASSSSSSSGGNFSQVLSPEDVAVYGGLCALATLEREELKSRVVDSPAFKAFLELVPTMRELVQSFCQSRYGQCLQQLSELRPELELDLHLAEHVPALTAKVRDRCLLQFFTPYLSVDLRRMAAAFQAGSVEELEGEAARLIMSNQLQARIDSQNKTLHRRKVDRRDAGYLKVLGMGQDFVREVRSLLLRVSLLEHGVVVEGGGRGGGGRGGGYSSGAAGGLQDVLGEGALLDPEELEAHHHLHGLRAGSSSSSGSHYLGGHYEENQQDALEGGAFKDG